MCLRACRWSGSYIEIHVHSTRMRDEQGISRKGRTSGNPKHERAEYGEQTGTLLPLPQRQPHHSEFEYSTPTSYITCKQAGDACQILTVCCCLFGSGHGRRICPLLAKGRSERIQARQVRLGSFGLNGKLTTRSPCHILPHQGFTSFTGENLARILFGIICKVGITDRVNYVFPRLRRL